MPAIPQTIQDIKDPRQLKAIALYRNPKSDTFGNLKQSMIEAGYDDAYANSITGQKPAWLAVSAQKDVARVIKAEENMDEDLNIEVSINGHYNIDKAKLRFEVSKFILKSLAKQKYTEDEESTPPTINLNIINYAKEKAKLTDATVIHDHVEPSAVPPSTPDQSTT